MKHTLEGIATRYLKQNVSGKALHTEPCQDKAHTPFHVCLQCGVAPAKNDDGIREAHGFQLPEAPHDVHLRQPPPPNKKTTPLAMISPIKPNEAKVKSCRFNWISEESAGMDMLVALGKQSLVAIEQDATRTQVCALGPKLPFIYPDFMPEPTVGRLRFVITNQRTTITVCWPHRLIVPSIAVKADLSCHVSIDMAKKVPARKVIAKTRFEFVEGPQFSTRRMLMQSTYDMNIEGSTGVVRESSHVLDSAHVERQILRLNWHSISPSRFTTTVDSETGEPS